MQAVMTMTAVSTLVSTSQTPVSKSSSSFSQLLASAGTGEMKEENSVNLGDLILSLFSESDLSSFWKMEAKDAESVESLLEGLPLEVKEAIEELLQEQFNFSEAAANPTPEFKLAMLLQIMFNDQQEILPPSDKKHLNEVLEKWFPGVRLDQKEPLTKQVEQIFGQVTKLLKEQSAYDRSTFLKVMENLTAANKVQSFAEQAFQRYVPTKQAESAVSTIKEMQNFQSPLSPIEQWTLKVPVSQGDGQKEQFFREVQQIISRGKLLVTETGFTKLQIRLTPEHLGTIEIQLTQKHGEIAAKIIASSHGAKDALDGQLTQLKQAFAGQNIEFEKVEVFFQGEEQTFEFHDQGNQSFEEQKQSDENKTDDTEMENLSFEEQLSQLVLNEKV